MAEVCKTDLRRIVNYLDTYAKECGEKKGQKYKARQYYLNQMSNKLKLKLNKFHNEQTPVRK